jgi:hypothetical protein
VLDPIVRIVVMLNLPRANPPSDDRPQQAIMSQTGSLGKSDSFAAASTLLFEKCRAPYFTA